MTTFLVVAVVSLLLFLSALQSQACKQSSPPSTSFLGVDEEWFEESLNITISFKTLAENGPIIFIGFSETEDSGPHQILNLSLSDGGLHLQVYPDTLILPTNKTGEKILYNDDQWHNVSMDLKVASRGPEKFVRLMVDEFQKTLDVATLPDSSLHYSLYTLSLHYTKLHYESYSCRHTDLLVLIGGADFVEDHPADGQEIDYVGCFRNVSTRQTIEHRSPKSIGEEHCNSRPLRQYCSGPLTTDPGQGDGDM